MNLSYAIVASPRSCQVLSASWWQRIATRKWVRRGNNGWSRETKKKAVIGPHTQHFVVTNWKQNVFLFQYSWSFFLTSLIVLFVIGTVNCIFNPFALLYVPASQLLIKVDSRLIHNIRHNNSIVPRVSSAAERLWQDKNWCLLLQWQEAGWCDSTSDKCCG